MDKENKENAENLEVSEYVGASDDRSGIDGAGIDGAGAGIDGADVGPLGGGNGATIGGSGGSSDDSGGSSDGGGASNGPGGERGGDSLGRESGDIQAPGGNSGDSGGNVGSAPKRGRGRPRRDRGNSVTGGNGGRANSSSGNVLGSQISDLGKQKEPKRVPDEVFEEQDFSKLTKSEIEEMAAKVLQGLFFMIAGLLKQEHWQLSNTEAVQLGKATWDCVKTLPTKQNKRLEKLLKEYAPWIKLLMVSATILGGRAALSLEMAKTARLQKENEDLRNFRRGAGAGAGNGIDTDGAGAGGFPGVSDEFIQ